jgi:hypothetical protein
MSEGSYLNGVYQNDPNALRLDVGRVVGSARAFRLAARPLERVTT